MKKYFLVKNLFGYEKVLPPPINLPKDLITVYITDADETKIKAKELGWNIVKKTDLFLDTLDKKKRRDCVAFINSYPTKVVPEINDADFIFICDSNIVSLFKSYEDFVNKCNFDKALFFTSGYYQGNDDNIQKECDRSLSQIRWSYNHKQIKDSTSKYIKELESIEIDYKKLSVVSAKYIGWNIKHKEYEKISNMLYQEYSENIQGNIILTYFSGIFKNDIFNYYSNDYSGFELSRHNFLA